MIARQMLVILLALQCFLSVVTLVENLTIEIVLIL